MDLKPYKCSTQWYAKVYLVLHKIWIIANEKVTFSLWIRGKRFSYLNLLFLGWLKGAGADTERKRHISPHGKNTFIRCVYICFPYGSTHIFHCTYTYTRFGPSSWDAWVMLLLFKHRSQDVAGTTARYDRNIYCVMCMSLCVCVCAPALCIFLFPLTMRRHCRIYSNSAYNTFLFFYFSSFSLISSTALFSLLTFRRFFRFFSSKSLQDQSRRRRSAKKTHDKAKKN